MTVNEPGTRYPLSDTQGVESCVDLDVETPVRFDPRHHRVDCKESQKLHVMCQGVSTRVTRLLRCERYARLPLRDVVQILQQHQAPLPADEQVGSGCVWRCCAQLANATKPVLKTSAVFENAVFRQSTQRGIRRRWPMRIVAFETCSTEQLPLKQSRCHSASPSSPEDAKTRRHDKSECAKEEPSCNTSLDVLAQDSFVEWVLPAFAAGLRRA
eukprot:5362231-Amphidinium_carterae.1